MTAVLDVLRTTGRLLWRHWPALLAWYAAGLLGRYVVIEVAGFVGAYNAVLGSLLLPLAILSRLVALVAMLLVVRDGMREFDAISSSPGDAADRRRQFGAALMAGILPFFAFYAAWGYLREDAAAYSARVLEVTSDLNWTAIVDETEQAGDGLAGALTITPITVGILVLAFVLRWLLKRFRERLPRWSGVVAAYLEALWVYFAALVLTDMIAVVSEWVQTRQAMAWLDDVRATITAVLVPLAWVWEAVEWFLGEAGGIILLPLAWLTIAGVVYGQAVAPTPVSTEGLGGEVGARVRSRYRSLPARLRARLADIWADLVSRFTPIGNAIVLMWRAGPVLIGGFVLLYTVLLAVQRLGGVGLPAPDRPARRPGFLAGVGPGAVPRRAPAHRAHPHRARRRRLRRGRRPPGLAAARAGEDGGRVDGCRDRRPG
ncbi:hypothetical protein R8Z57_04750 [Microbacterium sp. M3]|uniref:Uncharacterized protein n=1 Tax=Microbacterium arthrosphaerae TaxID=792652 RepID=A0ABU4H049_9MICO|nr:MULTISPECIES: hypothetical protein [Microbacterium]MDW4572084.1 hypothetical protein [Microbacterium arthrosphaerae]MDW7605939.1 hypothetical protein [Microbacterium sp. M3]